MNTRVLHIAAIEPSPPQAIRRRWPMYGFSAVRQWRFEPGRLAGRPVDVLVTVMLDFWIR